MEDILLTTMQRIEECVRCPYFHRCYLTVDDPKDKPDGSCAQKDIFKEEARRANEMVT